MRINFKEEICCERCNEPIHTHFDCPSCGRIDVGSNFTTSVFEDLAEWGECTLRCRECGAKFKTTYNGEKQPSVDSLDWEQIGED